MSTLNNKNDSNKETDKLKLFKLEDQVKSLERKSQDTRKKLGIVIWVLAITVIVLLGYLYLFRGHSNYTEDGLYSSVVCNLDRNECFAAKANVALAINEETNSNRVQIFEIFLNDGKVHSFEECLFSAESCIDTMNQANWSISPIDKIDNYRIQP